MLRVSTVCQVASVCCWFSSARLLLACSTLERLAFKPYWADQSSPVEWVSPFHHQAPRVRRQQVIAGGVFDDHMPEGQFAALQGSQQCVVCVQREQANRGRALKQGQPVGRQTHRILQAGGLRTRALQHDPVFQVVPERRAVHLAFRAVDRCGLDAHQRVIVQLAQVVEQERKNRLPFTSASMPMGGDNAAPVSVVATTIDEGKLPICH